MTAVGLDLPADLPDPVGAARTLEALGEDVVSFFVHAIGTGAHETWTLLTWVAASTTRIGIATRVLSVPLRNPVLLAEMARTLDRLAPGRLVLGLGGGSADDELRAAGIAVPTAREKVDGLAAAARAIRRVWTPDGPRVPVWFGTFGPRALRLTGELADGWIPSLGYAGADRLPAMRAAVLAAAADSGRDPASVTCALNVTVHLGRDGDADVSGDATSVTRRLAELVDQGFGTLNLKADPAQWQRIAAEVVPALRGGNPDERSGNAG
jgi:alkanesulfonate monooxygenase SsuD/methylene tetrahydromethanopterin reductase-like flavin-dependent oxidoreductase (luciferase family)